MTATPEPKPTLLASIGVSGGEAPPGRAAHPDDVAATTAPPRKPRQSGTRRVRPSPPPRDANDQHVPEAPETLPLVLDRIRDRHRARRSAGTRTPLAPLNVDVPLDLLEHVRQVSQDIPYPLRRLAEEAIELWLEATGNQAAPKSAGDTGMVGE